MAKTKNKTTSKKKQVDDEITISLNGRTLTFKDNEAIDREIKQGTLDPTNILGGTLKDGYCNYDYEIVAGLNSGKKHKVDGKTCLIMADMTAAFRELRPHMAFIDDQFAVSGVTILDIADMQNHSITNEFKVTGFRVKGSGVNETVVIFGEKFSESVGDHIAWSSPKIAIGELSFYKWKDNLNSVINKCREEVRLYHHGKYTKEKAELIANPDQTSILDKDQQEGDTKNTVEDFEAAKV